MAAKPKYIDDWAADATTTMGEAPRFARTTRTTGPVWYDSARPRAVRIPGQTGCYVAWSQIRKLHGVHFTVRYDLELAADDDLGPLSDAARVASVATGEYGAQCVIVFDRRAEESHKLRTVLWKRLMEIRGRAVAAGLSLLDWRGLDDELKSRRARDLPGDDA